MFSSVVGGGVEQILDMEINEFILWHEVARKVQCQRYL
ncbi:hypothetical protein N499_1112 [Wolbachia pipientis wVitA]|nr:phage-related protein [Wolbachia endosymbiont wVitB of Nasonia vitripennis phage WOVitB]ONI57194.1 hypothetical protein N499_1112 [Wolbachia pipientis wVitA]